MSKPATVINQLKTQLTNYATLSAYVKNVYLGVRDDIANFPCIIIEPLGIAEIEDRYPMQLLKMTVAVIGYIKVFDKDKQIVGSGSIKGIFDFENDVKLGIDSDRTLSGNCIHTAIKDTVYDFTEFPERSFTETVEILFEQQRAVRT